jgi:hypothetical protein
VANGVVAGAADATPPADGVLVPVHAVRVPLSSRIARIAVRPGSDARSPGSSRCVTVDSIASAVHENAVPGIQDGGESMGLLPSLV